MGHFRFEVARQIKGKMPSSKKKELFESRLSRVCVDKRWPQRLAIVKEEKKERYLSFEEATQRGTLTTLSPENRANAIAACNHFVEGHREVLWQAIENMKAKK